MITQKLNAVQNKKTQETRLKKNSEESLTNRMDHMQNRELGKEDKIEGVVH